ncbi:MAG: hypothetical protein LIO90_06155 [Bacteroidales bacterium]|nr:hypothetical protein [Bacteroidales bacterium]
MEEPSDEALAQIMKEAAAEAREKAARAEEQLFERIRQRIANLRNQNNP